MVEYDVIFPGGLRLEKMKNFCVQDHLNISDLATKRKNIFIHEKSTVS